MLLALVLTINAEAQRGERRTPRGGRPERTMTQIDTLPEEVWSSMTGRKSLNNTYL